MFGQVGRSLIGSVGLAAILAACSVASPSLPSASPSAAAPASESPSLLSTASPASPPAAWSSLAWSPPVAMPDGQFVSDLVPWGPGYVGVGGIQGGSGLDVEFFTSMDGTHWTLAARLPTAKSNVFAAHVVVVGTRLLAVGQAVMDAPGEKPDFPPPLWLSDDGHTWSPVTSPTWDAAFSTVWPARLLAGPRGVVAVSSGTDPVVLFSPDASAWTRATLPVQEHAIAQDAVAWTGGFVIVGRDGQPDQFSQAVINSQSPPGVGLPAVWSSQDGVRWTEAAVEGSKVAGGELRQVVAIHAGLLAVGIDSTADFFAGALTSWTSSDGQTWSIAAGSQWPLGANGYPTFATDGQHGLVLGWAPEGSTLAAWATADGATWTRLTTGPADNAPAIDCGSHPDCVRLDQAWLVPDGLIVAGTLVAGSGGQELWMATPGS